MVTNKITEKWKLFKVSFNLEDEERSVLFILNLSNGLDFYSTV